MAVILAPASYGSRSANIGTSMGEGLSKTLQMLTQNKIMQQQQQQQQQQMMQMQNQQRLKRASEVSQGLQQTLGVSPEEADSISMLPPEQQKFVFERLFGTDEEGQADQGGAEQQLQGIGGLLQQGQQGQELEGAEQEEIEEGSEQYNNMVAQVQEAVNNLSPEEKKTLKKEIETATKDQQAKQAPKKKTMRERLRSAGVNFADREKAVKLGLAKQKQELAEMKFKFHKRSEVNKQTKEFYDKITGEGKDSFDSNMRLNRMDKLNKEEELSHPSTVAVIDTVKKGVWGIGLNLEHLMTPASQEFQKLSKDFLKNAKSIFGSRVTQSEIQMFLQTIPSLLQTREGRHRVIQNMKMLNQAAIIRKKAMTKIMDRHGGDRPLNIKYQVDKTTEKKLNKLSEKFASSVREELPELQTRQAFVARGGISRKR